MGLFDQIKTQGSFMLRNAWCYSCNIATYSAFEEVRSSKLLVSFTSLTVLPPTYEFNMAVTYPVSSYTTYSTGKKPLIYKHTVPS